MNILIIISSLSYGGAEKQAVLDANMLSNNHNVILVCFKKGPLSDLVNSSVKVLQINKGNYITTAIRLKRVIRTNNIVVIHSLLFASMIISALTALFINVKVVWHFHSHEYKMPLIYQLFYKILGKTRNVSKILFVNHELMNFISQRFSFPQEKLGIYYNTASFNNPKPIKEKDNPIIIGYIGRLAELKRVYLLIELAEFLLKEGFDKFIVTIVGDGPMREILEKTTLDRNLTNFIQFKGFQTETGLYYDQIDIFALPSREECLSMAAIDAGAKGIPIVAFAVGGNNEIVDSGKTGFIVSTKEEFFESIYLLITHKEMRTDMGNLAASYCHEKFGVEQHLKVLNHIYYDLNLS